MAKAKRERSHEQDDSNTMPADTPKTNKKAKLKEGETNSRLAISFTSESRAPGMHASGRHCRALTVWCLLCLLCLSELGIHPASQTDPPTTSSLRLSHPASTERFVSTFTAPLHYTLHYTIQDINPKHTSNQKPSTTAFTHPNSPTTLNPVLLAFALVLLPSAAFYFHHHPPRYFGSERFSPPPHEDEHDLTIMPAAYTAQQKNAIAEFVSVTQCDKSSAAKLLKQANWNVGAAANL